MAILEFLRDFPNNESCKLHFKAQREQQGITCKKCSCTSTTGFQAAGNGNAHRAGSEPDFAVERLWRVPILAFIPGICAWPL